MSYWQRWGLGVALLGLNLNIRLPGLEWLSGGSPLVVIGTLALMFTPNPSKKDDMP